MLTVATETIRHCIRVYEWSGLYVPVVHARHTKELVQEPGAIYAGYYGGMSNKRSLGWPPACQRTYKRFSLLHCSSEVPPKPMANLGVDILHRAQLFLWD